MEREWYRRGKLLSQQANGLIIIRAVDSISINAAFRGN